MHIVLHYCAVRLHGCQDAACWVLPLSSQFARPAHPAPAHRSRPLCCSEKIVQGRVDKIAKTLALLEQPFIKDSGKTVAGALRPLRPL